MTWSWTRRHPIYRCRPSCSRLAQPSRSISRSCGGCPERWAVAAASRRTGGKPRVGFRMATSLDLAKGAKKRAGGGCSTSPMREADWSWSSLHDRRCRSSRSRRSSKIQVPSALATSTRWHAIQRVGSSCAQSLPRSSKKCCSRARQLPRYRHRKPAESNNRCPRTTTQHAQCTRVRCSVTHSCINMACSRALAATPLHFSWSRAAKLSSSSQSVTILTGPSASTTWSRAPTISGGIATIPPRRNWCTTVLHQSH